MTKYSDKIREIKKIGSNAYNLSLKTLEYRCDIYRALELFEKKRLLFYLFNETKFT